eukprot:CFRG2941T1
MEEGTILFSDDLQSSFELIQHEMGELPPGELPPLPFRLVSQYGFQPYPHFKPPSILRNDIRGHMGDTFDSLYHCVTRGSDVAGPEIALQSEGHGREASTKSCTVAGKQKATRQQSHREVEKRRRDNLVEGIKRLEKLLPDPGEKVVGAGVAAGLGIVLPGHATDVGAVSTVDRSINLDALELSGRYVLGANRGDGRNGREKLSKGEILEETGNYILELERTHLELTAVYNEPMATRAERMLTRLGQLKSRNAELKDELGIVSGETDVRGEISPMMDDMLTDLVGLQPLDGLDSLDLSASCSAVTGMPPL